MLRLPPVLRTICAQCCAYILSRLRPPLVTSSIPGAPGNPRPTRLIASLRERFRLAEQNRDAMAKQALFREAIYLGIQPQVFTEID